MKKAFQIITAASAAVCLISAFVLGCLYIEDIVAKVKFCKSCFTEMVKRRKSL